MANINETNYLAITAMLAARTSGMLSAERLERMIAAPTDDEAVKDTVPATQHHDIVGKRFRSYTLEINAGLRLFQRKSRKCTIMLRTEQAALLGSVEQEKQ